MDMNGHINNVTYLAWALETVPIDVYLNYSLIQVKKELLYSQLALFLDCCVYCHPKVASSSLLAMLYIEKTTVVKHSSQ